MFQFGFADFAAENRPTKAVFNHFDQDGGGKISTNELVMSGLVDSWQQAESRIRRWLIRLINDVDGVELNIVEHS